MNQQYQQVVQKLEEISHLNGVMSTLGWDQEVVMPAGAGEARAKQMAALAGVIHERMADSALGEGLRELADRHWQTLDVEQRGQVLTSRHSCLNNSLKNKL